MKRSANISIDKISQSSISNKVFLIERTVSDESSLAATNSFQKSTRTLVPNSYQMHTFLKINTLNNIDAMERQINHSQELMDTVIPDAERNIELNQASCNFVKRPGHIYHLYERFPGQKYLSILSPEEWKNAPHRYIGSWKLQADYTWILPPLETIQYDIFELPEHGFSNIPNNTFSSIQYHF